MTKLKNSLLILKLSQFNSLRFILGTFGERNRGTRLSHGMTAYKISRGVADPHIVQCPEM